MRFQIATTSATRLPLISELPHTPVALLEGVNGVGKSITIQLLELCSGRRPRMTGTEWAQLCDAIGRVKIEVTRLNGASSIKWTIDGQRLAQLSQRADDERASVGERPGARPEDRLRSRAALRVDALPSADWFESITIDERAVDDLSEVRSLLAVDRIAGDVGLVETIAEFGLRQGVEARRMLSTQLDLHRLDDAADLLAELATITDAVVVPRVRERTAEAETARHDLELIVAAKERSGRQWAELERIAKDLRRSARIATDGPALRAQREARTAEIDVAKREGSAIDARRQALSMKMAGSEDLEQRLRTAESTATRYNTQLANASTELAKKLTAAGVKAADDAAEAIEEVRLRLAEARMERDARNARPALREATGRLLPPVRDLIGRGLGDQILLAACDDFVQLTVEQLGRGLQRRGRELSTPDDAADEAAVIVERLEQRLAALQRLPELAKRVKSATESRKKARKRVAELSADLASPLAEELRDLHSQREAIDDRIVQASTDRAVLGKQLDELGTQQERDQLERLVESELARLDIAPDDLEEQLRLAWAAMDSDQADHRRILDAHDAMVAAATRDEAELRAAVGAMLDARFAWALDAIESIPAAEDPLEVLLQMVERLQRGIGVARDRLDRTRDTGLGIQETARTAADQLRDGSIVTAGQPRLDRHIKALEDITATWLRDPAVVRALLGQGATDIEVDLRTRQVSWSADGKSRTQSLEAFSSGQQAFGFLKARLELTSPEVKAASNRLVALDEFGAFISGERQRELRTWLAKWSAEESGLQLLLILPARDFQELAQRASGIEATRYAELAENMRDPGYVFIELDGTPT